MIDVKKLPVQARLTAEELALIDEVAAVARQRVTGLEMSRAEALRLSAVHGAKELLSQWRHGTPTPEAIATLVGQARVVHTNSAEDTPGPAMEHSAEPVPPRARKAKTTPRQ